jgi:hypothetical protein
MNKLIIFVALCTQIFQLNAYGYSYRLDANGKPDKWNDAEVETFLFLNQIQTKTGLNKDSNLCIDVSQPVPGGTQTMRIISKVTDNENQKGMFEVAEIGVKDGNVNADVATIKQIVNLSSGYQQGIMNYSNTDAVPPTYTQDELKSYMSAEVIGYTDGLAVDSNGLTRSWVGADGKEHSASYNSNTKLGMLRADYLTDQLGLNNTFGKVEKTSKTCDIELKNETREVKECSTRRSAEVRMNFQTSSQNGSGSTWVMPTQMMPEGTQKILQFEAAMQVHSALRELNDDILHDRVPGPTPTPDPKVKTTSKTKVEPVEDVKNMSAEFQSFCAAALKDIQKSNSSDVDYCTFTPRTGVKLTGTASCVFTCSKGAIKNIFVTMNGNSTGGKFTVGSVQVNGTDGTINKHQYTKQIEDLVKTSEGTKTALASLNTLRDQKMKDHIKAKFPNCANEPYWSDLVGTEEGKTTGLVGRVASASQGDYTKLIRANGSIDYSSISGDHVLVQAAYLEANGGLSGRLLRCFDMSRAMNEVYKVSTCKPGKVGELPLGSITFPHKDANLGCRYCRFGWSTDKSGAATFRERSYSNLPETDARKTRKYDPNDGHNTLDTPTFEALQAPGIHEISDCPDCQCSNKNKKLKKIFQVEQASNSNIVTSAMNSSSCYCSTPVVPSCAVGPGGQIKGEDVVKLDQKYFFDACTGKFEKAVGDNKGAQITNLLNTLNKNCVTDKASCPTVDIKTATSNVNAMLCETQKYKLPTDDPIADCTKEDATTAQ